METMIIKVVICIALPLLFLCGLIDKKSRQILYALLFGCISCLLACYLNSWIYSEFNFSYYYLTTTVSPFIEELFKFIPILLFAKFYSHDKKYLLSISFAVGMGFAIIENSFMLSQYSQSATIIWMVVRGIGTGLMHGISTSIVGIGVYLAFKDKNLLLTASLATLFFAMMYHGAYNAIIQTDDIKYLGIFIPILSYGIILAVLNKQRLNQILKDK